MGQALYRKYRSKQLSELVGQEHITGTLSRALKAGHISHAYLFTGPKGVGKTSVARILAHEVNGLPYDDDSSHLDIIEIDAASNRRIDEIRELRERVHTAPTSAKYKVYIIDEVHMLTREAFNALLKTLEEPPAHVIFILATTESHKLPETIISRTQRFTFRPVTIDKVTAHLREIADAEKITVDDQALELIARHGEGSFRDSISLLDQARTVAAKLSVNDIRGMLGLAPDEAVASLITDTEAGDSAALVTHLQQLREQGLEAAQLAKQLSGAWRAQLLSEQTSLPAPRVLTLLGRLLSVASSSEPFSLLEIILLEIAMSITPTAPRAAPATSKPEPPPKPEPKLEQEAKRAPVPAPQPSKPKSTKAEAPAGDSDFDATIWLQLLESIKKTHNTLYGIVRMATPQFSDNKLHLNFRFAFHQKRVNEPTNKMVIATALHELTGQKIEITCEVDADANPPKPDVKPTLAAEPALETISNIFGGGELLESEN
jgi:DNA polymerase III subunit gamma/tau